MKIVFLSLVVAMTVITTFTACEKPNYQHPKHRK